MPSKPDYYHDLSKNVEILKSKVATLEKDVDEVSSTVQTLNEKVAEVTKDVAVIKQQVADQTKRLEEWDRRFWGLLFAFVGAVLSLAAGLIVSLTRR